MAEVALPCRSSDCLNGRAVLILLLFLTLGFIFVVLCPFILLVFGQLHPLILAGNSLPPILFFFSPWFPEKVRLGWLEGKAEMGLCLP